MDPHDTLQAYFEPPQDEQPTPALKEQRLSIRASVKLDASLETSGHALAVRVRDISKSGLCVESAEAVATGTTVNIVFDAAAFSLHAPERSIHVSVNGQVVRLVPLDAHPFTIGIAVVDDDEIQRTLQSIVLRVSIADAKKRTGLRPHPWI